jgi:hypothetical protein
MKKAGFSRVHLQADEKDRLVFDFIVHRFEFYDCYYGHFFSIQPEIQYKEFTTLKADFKQYHSDVILVCKDVDVKFIQSLKRSCELLRNKLYSYRSAPRKDLIMFLEYCIINLDVMIDKFIDEILASLG